jgi:hypothetical protein
MTGKRRFGGGSSGLSRRGLLLGLGGGLTGLGGLLISTETVAFGSASAPRGTNVTTAADDSAIVGLLVSDSVQKNNQEPLVDVTNDVGEAADVTVTLDSCSDGTLHGPDGSSGCSVTFPLGEGNSRTVEIEAAVKDRTIPFDITVTSTTFRFEGARETDTVAGNKSGAVSISKLAGFAADTGRDEWTIDQVKVEDNDGDDDLDRVEYEIEDDGGTVRATRTDTCGCNGGSKYQPNGNPAVTISPDDPSYSIPTGETYTLTVRGYDADGNSDFETRETST